MHERGVYGRQALKHHRRGYGIQPWGVRPHVMGMDASASAYATRPAAMDPETKFEVASAGVDILATVVSVIGGGWIGGKATPADPNKGRLIGGVAGYFASLWMKQNAALNRIAEHTKALTP